METKTNKSGTSPRPPAPSRIWLEIDLEKIRQNYLRVSDAVAPCDVMPVLKANAYGTGVENIACALAAAGARRFGVADLNEALNLADVGYQPQILGAVLPEEIPAAIAAKITLPITDIHSAREISRQATAGNTSARCQILIDSGMGRLGILLPKAAKEILDIAKMPSLELEGIYSHFPVANYPENNFTRQQIENFVKLIRQLNRNGLSFARIHIANSDGINNFPAAAKPPFNQVRCGINLYGAFDISGGRAYKLHAALSLKSRLAQVRRLPAGMAIGYGHTYRLLRPTMVGTVPAGYDDGLPVALSNRGYALIRNRPCPIIGRVSMDYCTVALDPAPEAQVGDEVVLLGGRDSTTITVQDWAELKGSNTYDIICSFGSRVRRVYV